MTYDDLLVAVTRMREREPAEVTYSLFAISDIIVQFVRKLLMGLVIITLVSGIFGTFLLSFLVVTAVLTAPGVFVNYGDMIKDKIRSITNAKKTN